jgi:hypothetical protein
MGELVKAYIDWQVCEMGDIPAGDPDELYPIPALPRVRYFYSDVICL